MWILVFILCQTPEVAKAVITGPTGGMPGDMLEYRADESDAEDYHWVVLPKSFENYRKFEGDTILLLSGRGRERLTIVLAVALAGTVSVETMEVEIGQPRSPDGPIDPPEDPDPPPPDPKPRTLSQLVQKWVSEEVPIDSRDKAVDLAKSFETVADLILNESIQDSKELLGSTVKLGVQAKSSRQALGEDAEKWKGFFGKLSRYIHPLPFWGSVNWRKEGYRTWIDIAEGLSASANSSVLERKADEAIRKRKIVQFRTKLDEMEGKVRDAIRQVEEVTGKN